MGGSCGGAIHGGSPWNCCVGGAAHTVGQVTGTVVLIASTTSRAMRETLVDLFGVCFMSILPGQMPMPCFGSTSVWCS
jgi:hypothetical protein